MKPYRKTLPLPRKSRVRAFHAGPDGFNYDLHFHPEHEIVLILEGRGDVHLGRSTIPFAPGDVVVLDEEVSHTFVTTPGTGDGRSMVLQFHEHALGTLDVGTVSPTRANGAACAIFDGAEVDQLAPLFKEACDTTTLDEDPSDALVSRALLYRALAVLSHMQPRTLVKETGDARSASDRELLNRILNFVNNRHHEAISLSDAATEAGMRPESLCRFLKRHTGLTFTEHLNETRLHHAAHEIVATERLILEIALDAGYQNLSYFNRRFKRRYGVTPQAWRRRHRRHAGAAALPASASV
ncbi:MAG: hypothetical protein CMJ83_20500 [Planctomycetes bacterium]|nr:hypothetical protein [Planctomycetota bacterium]